MSAPDKLRQLADRLTEFADDSPAWDHLTASRNRDVAAAAVALRHHANLLDAIGDEHRPMWDDPTSPGCYQTEPHRAGDPAVGCCTCGDDGWPCAIAAAVSPPPAPTCPTCGGDGVVLSGGDDHDCRDHEDGCFEECPDPCHNNPDNKGYQL